MKKTITVKSPVTEKVIGVLPSVGKEEIERMLEKARLSLIKWSSMALAERIKIFENCIQKIEQNRERLREVLIEESGKPEKDAAGEIESVLNKFRFLCEQSKDALQPEKINFENGLSGIIERKAKGVIGVISPWNFPVAIAAGMFAPALIAGNSVILKPSEVTPYSVVELVKYLHEGGIPRDVLQLAVGDGETGRALVESDIDMISFTGSHHVGKLIRESLSSRLTSVVLELGGKDPFIVMDDVNIEETAKTCVTVSLMNCGQMCCSAERIYVSQKIYKDFIEALINEVRKIKIYNGKDMNYDLGPLAMEKQLHTVEDHIADAQKKGAKVVIGGGRIGKKGYFFEPTILKDVDHSMLVMRDETFGPVIPVMSINSDKEVISLANDTIFGLSANVWCNDNERARLVANNIKCGTVWVNTNFVFQPEMPWGGLKESGVGKVMSKYGIWEYTDVCCSYSL